MSCAILSTDMKSSVVLDMVKIIYPKTVKHEVICILTINEDKYIIISILYYKTDHADYNCMLKVRLLIKKKLPIVKNHSHISNIRTC